jgi:hypothetical protein
VNTGAWTTAALPTPVGVAAVVVNPVCIRGRGGKFRSSEPIGSNEQRVRGRRAIDLQT